MTVFLAPPPAGRLAAIVLSAALAIVQPSTVDVDPLHKPFDEILDLYVRDGLVYYLALRNERARFDRYVDSISGVTADALKSWPRERQLAYWINAYNAFVLRTVIDNYPIRGRSADYPQNSIRQMPGAGNDHQRRALHGTRHAARLVYWNHLIFRTGDHQRRHGHSS